MFLKISQCTQENNCVGARGVGTIFVGGCTPSACHAVRMQKKNVVSLSKTYCISSRSNWGNLQSMIQEKKELLESIVQTG